MIKIETIVSADEETKKKFLEECLWELRKNIKAEEEFDERKHRTGIGPHKFHFKRVMDRKAFDMSYWLNSGNIFIYRKQLNHIFKKYEYLMNTKGV